jgi:hypothetical protein
MVITGTGDQRHCEPNCLPELTNVAADGRQKDRVFGRPRVGADAEREGRVA